ncbi:MAG: DUF3137 domain-containing protein [Victivallales bacterium]|jgi:hypothetical protein|nr:DUF3137 domain-containing protein [Victivallales bacterium]MBT7298175.1 DUF3137 domain-containing protein [Victivallales bacterium]
MGLLRSVFGPSKDEIWSQVAASIGGEYIDGGFWKTGALVFQHGEWQMVLDTYTVNTNTGKTHSHQTYTRLRAPFVNRDGLRFNIYRASFFSGLGKVFGMQDITIGDPLFDDQFIIKGNNEEKIRLLFNSAEIKRMIQQQPRIRLQVKDDEGWFGTSFPQGVDELCFICGGVVKDAHLLRGLFDLFAVTLERLVQIDSAYEDDPNVRLK